MKEKFLWAVAPIVGFFGLVWKTLSFPFNWVLYMILAIGVFADWKAKDPQGGISIFAVIIFAYSLITTYLLIENDKLKNGNTAD